MSDLEFDKESDVGVQNFVNKLARNFANNPYTHGFNLVMDVGENSKEKSTETAKRLAHIYSDISGREVVERTHEQFMLSYFAYTDFTHSTLFSDKSKIYIAELDEENFTSPLERYRFCSRAAKTFFKHIDSIGSLILRVKYNEKLLRDMNCLSGIYIFPDVVVKCNDFEYSTASIKQTGLPKSITAVNLLSEEYVVPQVINKNF